MSPLQQPFMLMHMSIALLTAGKNVIFAADGTSFASEFA